MQNTTFHKIDKSVLGYELHHACQGYVCRHCQREADARPLLVKAREGAAGLVTLCILFAALLLLATAWGF